MARRVAALAFALALAPVLHGNAWADPPERAELIFQLDREAEFEVSRAPDGTSVLIRIDRPRASVTVPQVADDDPLVGSVTLESPEEGGTLARVHIRKRPVRAIAQTLAQPFRIVLDLVHDGATVDAGAAPGTADAHALFAMDVPMDDDRGPRRLAPVLKMPPVGPGTEGFRQAVEAFDRGVSAGARGGFVTYLREHPDGAFAEAARYYIAEIDFQASLDGTPEARMNAARVFDALGQQYPRSPNVALGLLRMAEALRREVRLDEAAKVVEVVMDDYRNTPFARPARTLRGRVALQANHLRTALAHYGAVYREDPADPDGIEAAFGLAETLGRMGRYPEAVHFYEAGLKGRPGYPKSSPVMLENIGRALMEAGRFADARQVFLTLFNLYPNRYPPDLALSRVADSFRGEGRWERAEAGYLDVIDSHPKGEGALAARISLADLYVDRHRSIEHPDIATRLVGSRVASSNADELVAEAVRLYGEVMQLAPTDALAEEARYKLAFLYEELGDGAAALDQLNALVTRSPDTDWRRPARELGEAALATEATRLVRAGRPAAAVALYRRHKDPLFGGQFYGWQVHYPLGLAHEAVGLMHQAMRHYLALLGSSAPDAYRMRAVYRLGNLYLQDDQPAEALKRFTYFARRRPEAVTGALQLRMAEAHAALGHWDEAVAHYERYLGGLKEGADAGRVRMALADAYAHLGRGERAEALYAQVLKDAKAAGRPEDPQVRLRMAEVAYGQKRWDDAVADYEGAVAAGLTGEDSAWARLRVGLARRAQGRLDEAREALEALAREDGIIAKVAGEVAGSIALLEAGGRQAP